LTTGLTSVILISVSSYHFPKGNPMNHAEVTATLRSAIKAAGIKARVSKYVACGVRFIRVNPPTYEARFAEAEQAVILEAAIKAGLTGSRGSRIDPQAQTYGAGGNFEIPG
jgi:hypothetical protein